MVIHKPVLLKESIEGLNLKDGSIAVDATLGGGGHSLRILEEIGLNGKLVAIDMDESSLERFKIRNPKSEFLNKSKIQNPKIYSELGVSNVILIKDNFSNLGKILDELKVESVDAILADLGYSSIQLEDENYGMSFLKDAPLDMRLDKEGKLTAWKIVNEYLQSDLARIIKNYGEERFANSIAKKIVEQRKVKNIETTLELVEVIGSAVPERHKHAKTHFATRTFQAIRIEVNHELESLEKFIPVAIEKLSPGGRIAIISFHSLEDRIVKDIFRAQARGCLCPPVFPICQCDNVAKVKVITKKPIVASPDEVGDNARARSAKLRIAEKI